jgi:hypothetical protein
MTVVVGAICEDGRSAVVAADHLETSYTNLGIESGSKLVRISDSVVVGCSYGTQIGINVTRKIRESLGAPASDVNAVVAAVNSLYESEWRAGREAYLKKRLDTGYDGFRQLIVQANNVLLLEKILVDIEKSAAPGLEILVIGGDGMKMRLALVLQDGPVFFDERGMAAVGSGGMYATISLVQRLHSPEATLADTVFCVYEAKRAAEIVQTVGSKTDMFILQMAHKARRLEESAIAKLESMRKARSPRLTATETSELSALIMAADVAASPKDDPGVRPAASAPRVRSLHRRGRQRPNVDQ